MSRNTWINCNSWRFINKRYKSSLNFHTLAVCTPSLPCRISRWIFQKRCWCMWLSVCGVSRTKAPWRHLKSHAVNKSSWWRRIGKGEWETGKVMMKMNWMHHFEYQAESAVLLKCRNVSPEFMKFCLNFPISRKRLQNIFVRRKPFGCRNKCDEWIWFWDVFEFSDFLFKVLRILVTKKILLFL